MIDILFGGVLQRCRNGGSGGGVKIPPKPFVFFGFFNINQFADVDSK